LASAELPSLAARLEDEFLLNVNYVTRLDRFLESYVVLGPISRPSGVCRMKRTEEPPTLVTASTSELVSYRNPDGLILSIGNLYVTHHDAATASVWRAAQSALPD
jgi:hypothetical protein